MAIKNYNIKQITNFTAKELQIPIENIDILLPNDNIVKTPYYIFTFGKTENINNPFDDNVMLKFGYICEPNAIAYPIFINGKQIELGKTGIFEIQPETFIKKSNNADIKEDEEIEITFFISEIKVPANFSFSIDYITAISTNSIE